MASAWNWLSVRSTCAELSFIAHSFWLGLRDLALRRLPPRSGPRSSARCHVGASPTASRKRCTQASNAMAQRSPPWLGFSHLNLLGALVTCVGAVGRLV